MLKSLLRFAALFCCAGVFATESALELDPNMKLKPADADGLKYLLPAEKPLRLTGFCWYRQTTMMCSSFILKNQVVIRLSIPSLCGSLSFT